MVLKKEVWDVEQSGKYATTTELSFKPGEEKTDQ